MTESRQDLEELLRKMRMNLTQLQGQVSDAMRIVAQIVPADEPRHRCDCGWAGKSRYQFEEHRYRQHDGPVPEHYLAAERAAGFTEYPDAETWDSAEAVEARQRAAQARERTPT